MRVEPEVPYQVQKWAFDALSHTMVHEIQQYILGRFETELLELARKRFEDGYDSYGSAMYNWSPEVRFKNVMEELADAVVYMTSGPLPIPDEIPD